jgi:hypothetical protein
MSPPPVLLHVAWFSPPGMFLFRVHVSLCGSVWAPKVDEMSLTAGLQFQADPSPKTCAPPVVVIACCCSLVLHAAVHPQIEAIEADPRIYILTEADVGCQFKVTVTPVRNDGSKVPPLWLFMRNRCISVKTV